VPESAAVVGVTDSELVPVEEPSSPELPWPDGSRDTFGPHPANRQHRRHRRCGSTETGV